MPIARTWQRRSQQGGRLRCGIALAACVSAIAVPVRHRAAPGGGGGAIPTVLIAPGVELPLAGLGTWQYNSSVAEAAVLAALDAGYTHIDTALGYKNQDGVGRALAASGRARTSFFVTSKIPGGLPAKEAAKALALAVEQLFPGQKDAYVDLMLVHFPATWDGAGGCWVREQPPQGGQRAAALLRLVQLEQRSRQQAVPAGQPVVGDP